MAAKNMNLLLGLVVVVVIIAGYYYYTSQQAAIAPIPGVTTTPTTTTPTTTTPVTSAPTAPATPAPLVLGQVAASTSPIQYCQNLLNTTTIQPGYSYGNMSSDQAVEWEANDCNDNACGIWANQFGSSGTSSGSIPANLVPSWSMYCKTKNLSPTDMTSAYNVCKALTQKYPDMVPGTTWGSMANSSADQATWQSQNCNQAMCNVWKDQYGSSTTSPGSIPSNYLSSWTTYCKPATS